MPFDGAVADPQAKERRLCHQRNGRLADRVLVRIGNRSGAGRETARTHGCRESGFGYACAWEELLLRFHERLDTWRARQPELDAICAEQSGAFDINAVRAEVARAQTSKPIDDRELNIILRPWR